MLVGHAKQQEEFLKAAASGQMHHAWLLTGPEGVGKRCFADAAALYLLAGGTGAFAVPAGTAAAKLVQAGSHLDHKVVERVLDARGQRAGGITIEQIRTLLQQLHGTPALGVWRTVIVDSIDDLNRNAANALLKVLEEPAARTVFFLVSHAPGRLLPTIRSRCRQLRFHPLRAEETQQVLEERGVAEKMLPALLRLAEGAPGVVLRFEGVDMVGLAKGMSAVWRGGEVAAFARSFAPLAAQPRLEALLALAPGFVVRAARQKLDARLAELAGRLQQITADAVAFAYDRVQVAAAVAEILSEAGHLAQTATAKARDKGRDRDA